MDLTRRNIRTENLANAIQGFRDSSAPVIAEIRAIYQRWGDKREWQFVIARLTQTEEIAEPITEIYRDCAFIAMPVKEFTIAAFMEALSGDGFLLHKDFPPLRITEQNLNWTEELIPSYAGALGFPLRKYAARIAKDVQFTDTQLIGYGKPFRPSAAAYVKEFIGLPQFHGHSDARKGELHIELSDRRGAIRLGDGQLSIEGNASVSVHSRTRLYSDSGSSTCGR